MQKGTGVSIIVCCYNSKDRLPETLQCIASQKITQHINCEVIVVDNASIDGTAAVATRLWADLKVEGIQFSVVKETKPGLINARKRGIEVSKHEYLIFCDDDNWLATDYAVNAFNILSINPRIAALGGISIGVFEQGNPPSWIEGLTGGYAIGEQGTGPLCILDGDKYLVGAGVCLRKSAYIDIKKRGFEQLLSGRTGAKLIGGEDVELCYMFKLAGYEIAFSDRLTLHHYMPANRMTKKYLINMWRHYPEQWIVFEAYKVFLKGGRTEKNTKYKSADYWRQRAIAKLQKCVAQLPKYLYHKIKGTLNYTIAYETDCSYQFYVIRNTDRLVKIISNLELHLNLNKPDKI